MENVLKQSSAKSLCLPHEKSLLDAEELKSKGEDKSFLKTALAWQGAVTPKVLPRVAAATAYAMFVLVMCRQFGLESLSMTPFEYSGAILGMLLLLRVNAGLDRWWEARKIWGSIVNQSRNLAIVVSQYGARGGDECRELLKWIAAFPHVMKQSLRREREIPQVRKLLGEKDYREVLSFDHMPTGVGAKIAEKLYRLRKGSMDDFSFHLAERERSLLIDAIGACERIRNTQIPLVLAIKVRRFILIFLALLPFALFEKAPYSAPLIFAVVAYALFSVDEIGAELQNPFSKRNLSHLPLSDICQNIENNVLELEQRVQRRVV